MIEKSPGPASLKAMQEGPGSPQGDEVQLGFSFHKSKREIRYYIHRYFKFTSFSVRSPMNSPHSQ